ncbi:MAG: protein translocase subunit SecD [Candidatus Moranbacteria bacterium]|nr:protein translocase subunit SecD [Candidatus Moranbacteria bacterium]
MPILINSIKTWRLVAVLALAIIALVIAFPGLPYFKIGGWEIGKKISEMKISLGLDLQGGTYLVYQADLSQVDASQYQESLEGIRDVIERRVNAFGIAEPIVQTSKTGDEYKVTVSLAGVKDVTKAITMIGETPTLDFREPKNQEDVKLTEEQKKEAEERNSLQKIKAQSVLEKAQKNEKSFAELAKENSQDPSVEENEGDLGFFKKGVMVKEFEEAAFNPAFQKGGVWPELTKTDFGYHILKKIDERGEGDDKEVQIAHILFTTINEEYDEQALSLDPYKQTGLTGKNLERADTVFDPNTSEPQVSLTFDSEGKEKFRAITEKNLEKIVPIYLDGKPITMPVIKAVIADGKAVISGDFTAEEARKLEQRLNEGALPVPISLIHQQTVGASLGKESLNKSLIAGLVGFAIVAFFMIFIYRWPGIAAVIALSIYALLLVTLFKLLGITLTLSGIAGLILSIGIAVDANVLVFERIREELLLGKKKSLAVAEGFRRAWPSIRDGNASTIITCFVLIFLGTGMVRGFATALVIGVALSMFTAIIVTRTIVDFFLSEREDRGWWWGIRQSRNL